MVDVIVTVLLRVRIADEQPKSQKCRRIIGLDFIVLKAADWPKHFRTDRNPQPGRKARLVKDLDMNIAE